MTNLERRAREAEEKWLASQPAAIRRERALTMGSGWQRGASTPSEQRDAGTTTEPRGRAEGAVTPDPVGTRS
jgi:hypothetical protein